MVVSSPKRRSTRGKVNAATATSNSSSRGGSSSASLKKSAAKPSNNAIAAAVDDEDVGVKDPAMKTNNNSTKNYDNSSAVNNAASNDEGGQKSNNSNTESVESRNDGPAKAALTNNNTGEDKTKDAATVAMDGTGSGSSSTTGMSNSGNHHGPQGEAAMEVDTIENKAAVPQQQQQGNSNSAVNLDGGETKEDAAGSNIKNTGGSAEQQKELQQQQQQQQEGKKGSAAANNNNSFSMTLAIGPSDTQRLYMASKTFNEDIQKLMKGSGKENDDDSKPHASTTSTGASSSSALEKKRKAIDDSDETMSEDKTVNNTSTAVAASVQPSPSCPSVGATSTMKTPTATTTKATTTESSSLSIQQNQIAHLLKAATSSSNPLLSSFMTQMKLKSVEEQTTSLLFFLDADKSTKLLMAFDVLSDKKDVAKLGGGKGGDAASAAVPVVASTATKVKGVKDTLAAMAINDDCNNNNTNMKEDDAKVLSRRGLTLLFQSFLTSISTCVHNKGEKHVDKSSLSEQEKKDEEAVEGANKSPSSGSGTGDWTGSEKTAKEISEVAIFAANHLIEYAKKEAGLGEGGDPCVSFDQFGKWYNSGGFSLVPWLELLDLSKWDYTLKTNKNVAIEQVPLGGDGGGGTTTSSVKRAKFDNSSSPVEAIGSPTALFESGAAVGATPQQPQQQPVTSKASGGAQSFSSMFGEPTQSRSVVSFDFSGTAAGAFHIDITEENLVMLRQLVTRTGFASLTPQHVESVILKYSRCERRKYGDTVYVISRQQFGKFIRDVVPKDASKNFDQNEIENFSNYFTNFFTCFDYNWSDLKKDEVNAKELMVGFSFLCAGNKSAKLAAAYDLLDVDKNGYLTQRGLMQYLRAYLTMLAGISLLSSNKKTTTQIRKQLMSPKRNDAFLAVENGAKWTLSHFFKTFEAQHARSGSTRNNAVAFEDFAKWYTEGGYAVAPWLELLDLQKFLSLIGDFEPPQQPPGDAQPSMGDVLFTFPLAKDRSLVVLRDDAHYVRSVVSELGLLSLTCEDIWTTLSKDVAKRLGLKKSADLPVDQTTFVDCMVKILEKSKKPAQKSSWANFSPEETLKNFFLSFDLMQKNQVPLNQLMCGLTLLCGGKKSNKLGFAFGLFCTEGKSGKKKIQTMGHDAFNEFFRSFLIVMFSCCNQSLSLSADAVSQYISDTAQAVSDAVMAYWKSKKVDKVKFDHFSKWYNDGGFQMAPWLELLDLHKWVLADDVKIPAAAPSAAAPSTVASSAPVSAMPAKSKTSASATSNSVAHAPTVDKEIFNSLVASPNVKESLPHVRPGPSPNGDVPLAPGDDELLLNLDGEDMDMVSLRDNHVRILIAHNASSTLTNSVSYLHTPAGFFATTRIWWCS
jgi:Ca2+-binding EF-hand superfamily protein